MRLAIGRTGLLVGCALMAEPARPAESAAIVSRMEFRATGTIGTLGVTGTPVVRFEGTEGGSLTTGSAFELGSFVVTPPPGGSTTTYDHTPFEVAFMPRAVDGSPLPDGPPVVLKGLISGTFGPGSSDAGFWVDRLAYPAEEAPVFPSFVAPFRTGGLMDSIYDAPGASTRLPAAGGSVAFRAVIQAEPAPEPSTIAVLAAGLGLAAARGLRARRAGG